MKRKIESQELGDNVILHLDTGTLSTINTHEDAEVQRLDYPSKIIIYMNKARCPPPPTSEPVASKFFEVL